MNPDINMKTAVRDQGNALDATRYFGWMAELMENNPPAPEDGPIVAKMAKIGIVPGQDFDLSRFDPDVAEAIEEAPKAAWEKIVEYTKVAGQTKNGWLLNLKIGHYGTDYMARAWLAAFGIPANAPKDAVYLIALADADGDPLDAANHNYVIRFERARTICRPPGDSGR